ncbi:MAG: hypothetical protein RQ826_00400 [Xanthomonadales bacterium]|nr:hypothetical protein [Xanthomonadales bacterium]
MTTTIMKQIVLGSARAAALLVLLTAAPAPTPADGVIIDKVYHPYVQPLEKELEWRAIHQDEQRGRPDNLQLYRLAYGQSLGERWFAELYLVGSNSDEGRFDIEAYEIEAQRQLTEQGEYWADWGVLFELEKEADLDAWEFSTGLLAEKEWGRWSGTANLFLEYEWGSDIADEAETRLGLQARYRHSPGFEPAVEIYSGEDTHGIGPAVLGQLPLGHRRQIRWEAGVIFGVGSKSPDTTLRFLLEFEF